VHQRRLPPPQLQTMVVRQPTPPALLSLFLIPTEMPKLREETQPNLMQHLRRLNCTRTRSLVIFLPDKLLLL
jgi:hypothetical protein